MQFDLLVCHIKAGTAWIDKIELHYFLLFLLAYFSYLQEHFTENPVVSNAAVWRILEKPPPYLNSSLESHSYSVKI